MPVNYSDYCGYDYLVGRGMPFLGTMGSTLESFMTQLVKHAPPLIPQQVRGIMDAERSQDSL